MDLKMKAEIFTGNAEPVWDVKVEKGLVPIISGEEEDMQTATLAGFLEAGTIPQLPDVGVPWQDFLSKQLTFGELDSYIRQSIVAAGQESYYPQYEIDEENERLTMTVGREKYEY